MKTKRINLIDSPEHINKYLTHWTGRNKNSQEAFNILSTILQTKALKFSTNKISFPNSEITVESAMICFTDTPIIQSLDHCSRYNYFGISFNKEAMIQYGANPVLYLVENRIAYQEFINRINFTENNSAKFINWFHAILQPYNSKSYDSAEFNEREWRISRVLPYHWLRKLEETLGSHKEYPFHGKITRMQIGNDKNHELFFMDFDQTLIENIIVPEDYEKQAEELIKQLNLECDLLVINKQK